MGLAVSEQCGHKFIVISRESIRKTWGLTCISET